MHPTFGIERERNNKLFYKEYKDDKGMFHFHSPIELYFINEGEMEVVVNNRRRILKAGEMSVSLSFDAHAYKTPEHSRSAVLIIPRYACEEFIESVNDKRVATPFICKKEVVEKIKFYIRLLNNASNEIEKKGYIYVILGIIRDNIIFEKSGDEAETEIFSKLLLYINENFRNDLTVSSVASHFGYNANYISSGFKTTFNIGFKNYLSIVRLKNALMLMNEKKHNITYCAMESGFGSMRTFYRAFYNEFQCSPKSYRSLTALI